MSVAEDGETAVGDTSSADPSAFDVVVLDLVLPRLSGVEVFRRCRRLRPDLPVILSSGNVHDGLDVADVRAGVAGVLPKPYRPEDLTAAVDRALAAPTGPCVGIDARRRAGNGLGGRARA